MPVRGLGELTPTEFENLVFDLVRASGMKNLTWRTPGADGGRDFEGEHVEHDFAGGLFLEKWYIEAKRYQSAVDWPTVWEKIAYAQNAGANFLLIVTSSSLSPKCIDEVEKWNRFERSPKVRNWPKAEIHHRLTLRPAVGLKYGLVEVSERLVPALSPISRHLAKATMACQEQMDVTGSPGGLLELAAALSELLLVRSEDLERVGRIVRRTPLIGEPWFRWLSIAEGSGIERFDTPTIRALSCALRLVARAKRVEISGQGDGGANLTAIDARQNSLETGRDLFETVLLWGDLEGEFYGTTLRILPRNMDI